MFWKEEIVLKTAEIVSGKEIKLLLENKYFQSLNDDWCYLTINGKLVEDDSLYSNNVIIRVQPKLLGGKGGFGSMLRAIGAQIEKTTNREACRDLSGRRLRDINEEQRLKNWIAQQSEREKEAEERKRKKLEKLCREPKHEFKDDKYTEERLKMTEKINDSVEQGFKASTQDNKRKSTESEKASTNKKKKKKVKGMLDDFEDLNSDDSDIDRPGPSGSKAIVC